MHTHTLKFIIIGQRANLTAPLVKNAEPQIGSIETGMMRAPMDSALMICTHISRNPDAEGFKPYDVGSVDRPTAREHYGLDRAGVYLTRLRKPGTRRLLVVVFWLERVETGTEHMARAYQLVQITYPELPSGQTIALAADIAAMMHNEGFTTLADTLAELRKRVHPATMGGYAATLDIQNGRAALSGQEWSCCRLARQRSAGQCPTCPICSRALKGQSDASGGPCDDLRERFADSTRADRLVALSALYPDVKLGTLELMDAISNGEPHMLETFAYHVLVLARESGKFGLSCRTGIDARVEIIPSPLSETNGGVWDSVTINGHSCGNRHGGAKAYARMVAGESDWYRAE